MVLFTITPNSTTICKLWPTKHTALALFMIIPYSNSLIIVCLARVVHEERFGLPPSFRWQQQLGNYIPCKCMFMFHPHNSYLKTNTNKPILVYIHTCALLLILMLCTGKRFSSRKETSCLPLLNAGFDAGKSQTLNRQQTECPLTNRPSYQGSCKNVNSTARPYDEWAFNPLDFTADWISHLALATYMFVVVN